MNQASKKNKNYIKTKSIKKIFNMLLRVFTLLLKFFLVIHISKNLGDEALASYGVDFSFVMLCKFILGGELYLYFNKKYAKKSKLDTLFIHLLMVFFFYLLFLVAFPFLDYSPLIFFLISLEHLSQEIYRYLIVVKRPNLAGMMLFIRSGGWVAMYFLYFFTGDGDSSANLDDIYIFWATGCFISILISCFPFIKIRWNPRIDISLPRLIATIKQAFVLCLMYLVVAVFFRGVVYADRYFVSDLFSSSEAAAYVFFFSISSSVYAFIEAGVFSYRVSDLYKSNSLEDKKIEVKKILNESLCVSFVFSLATYIILPFLLRFMGKDYYEDLISVFFMLMAFNVAFSLSQMLSFGLIVRNKNKKFMITGLVFFLSYFLLHIFLRNSGLLNINTMALPLLIASLSMLLLRWRYLS